jgi:Zn-dependent peptidase ImmA (M78 family)
VKALFAFTRSFPHLAPYNAMLLHIQNPGVRYALRAAVWEWQYRQRVKPGARPYMVLRTMGPVSFVFDVSDVEPMDGSSTLPGLVTNPFPAKGKPPRGALKRLFAGAARAGVEIVPQDLGSNLAGDVRRATRKTEFFLRVNAKHSEAQQIGTIAHELAHVLCGHLGLDKALLAPQRPPLTIDVREFEAEAVAYLVTLRLNLDIGSVEYLSGYLQSSSTVLQSSLDAILKAAGVIEAMVRGTFRPKRKRKRVRAAKAETKKQAKAKAQESLDDRLHEAFGTLDAGRAIAASSAAKRDSDLSLTPRERGRK